ncbi:MAG TPA: DUF2726 domain-containing protein [Lysobacter sp.]|nr:DUF2726 domain-containing protein [Lysobacter sp.]
MDSLVGLFALGVFVVVVLAKAGTKYGRMSGGGGYPYRPAKALFSPAERSFLGVLDLAVGPEYRVFGKVRLADVATLKPELRGGARQGALNRIAGKHLDFVVCRATDLVPVCAVELNDRTHAAPRVRQRDELVRNVCETIGLPLLMVDARAAYSATDLGERFRATLGPAHRDRPLAGAAG